MSKNTSTTARIEAIEARFDRLETLLTAALTTASEPVVEAAPAKAPKARKAKARKAKASEPVVAAPVEVAARCLTRKNRSEFVAAHAWAKHLSTAAIATAVVNGEQSCVEGWRVGEGRIEMVTGMPNPARPVVAVVEPAAPAKARKAPAERAPEPKYGTKAWIAWARPTDDGAPRRANGSTTPKSEWKQRIKLANSGAFDAKQIDAILASA